MRTRHVAFVSALLAFHLVQVAGCGSSEPPNGKLACGPEPHPCPDGYKCSARTKTCWKGGIEPAVDASVSIDGSSSMDGALASEGQAFPDGGNDRGGTGIDGQGTDLSGAPADTSNGDVHIDASGPDLPFVDAGLPDAPISPVDSRPVDGGASCPSPKVTCNGQCVDLAAGGCCVATDCAGSCMTCTADHTCAPLKGQDDPTNRCTGTCDATGACKAKKGQACQTTATCPTGTTCADGYCCDKACTGTCEACDVANALGTCTTLSAGAQPRAGRTACTGTGTCAGTCNGTSAACAYPTVACGTAACSTAGYEAAGTCSQGTCNMPAVKTCPNACVVGVGCTDCKPAAVGCSGSGVPQLCDANGTWQNQTACLTGFTCSSGSCTCAIGKTNCTTACTDIQTDPDHCGACGHSCLGGTCVQGMCQPVVMTSNLASTPYLVDINANYIYFSQASTTINPASDAYRVGKSETGANPSVVYTTPDTFMTFYGVIGSTLLFSSAGNNVMYGYTIGSSSAKTLLFDGAGTKYAPMWSNVPPSRYAYIPSDCSTTFTINWYNVGSASPAATYSESTAGVVPTGGSIYCPAFAGGNYVYWARRVSDSAGYGVDTSAIFAVSSAAPSTRIQLAGGAAIEDLWIVDVNAVSIILTDGNAFYRVPLPSGNGTGAPQYVTSAGTSAQFATEDAKGFYWADDAGNINRCTPANCGASTTVLASGQGNIAGRALFQDDKALYWGRYTAPYRILRVAK